MPTETELRKIAVKALKKVNALVIPYVGSTMGMTDTPDVYISHKRWQGWVEFKGPETDVKDGQLYFRNNLRVHGTKAHILRLFPDNEAIFCYSFGAEPFFWKTGVDIIDALLEEDERLEI